MTGPDRASISQSGRAAGQEDCSDSELGEVATRQRTRQKKFDKHFPGLTGERVAQRISCALVGDILLQVHVILCTLPM